MTYFSYPSGCNQAANALQRAARDLLEKQTNLLVTNADAFVAELKADIATLNAENTRCRPLTFYTYGVDRDNISISMGVQFTVSFHLLRVREGVVPARAFTATLAVLRQ